MVAVAMLGTQGSHSGSYVGEVTSASALLFAKNGQVARMGDGYYCPEHGDQTLGSGGSTILTSQGTPVGIDGSVATCGAVLFSNFADTITVAS